MKKMIFAAAMALACMTSTAHNNEETSQSVNNPSTGMEAIQSYLQQVRNAQSRDELLQMMCTLDAKGFDTALFDLEVKANPFDASEYMMRVEPSAATLPWEYYAKPDAQQQAEVDAIRSQNKKLFKMAGYSDAEAEQKMQGAWIIEHQMAIKSHEDKQASTMSWAQLRNDYKGIDWDAYRDQIGCPKDINMVIVPQSAPLHMAEYILANTGIESLKAYIELHVLKTKFAG
jgi:putative endopeptidase